MGGHIVKDQQGRGNPYMTKDMMHIVLKLILLRKIQKREIYSYALIKEFDNPKILHFLKNHSGVKNDIYNTVKALEKSGYIKMSARINSGRLKKYYRITDRGKKAIRESRALFLKSMKELMKIVE